MKARKTYVAIAGISAVLVIVGVVVIASAAAPGSSGQGSKVIPSGPVPGSQGANSTDIIRSPKIDESKYGPYNGEHVHAAFMIILDGRQLDFSDSKYQLKSRFIHVENNDGTTLHRHAAAVPFGDFIKSVGMDITDSCFTTDDGSKYCSSENGQLRTFLNRDEITSIANYVIQDKDRLLITYGNETDSQINNKLDALVEKTIITVN